MKGAFKGFLYFVIVLLLFNIGTIWMGEFTTTFFSRVNEYLSGFYFLIIMSMCLNIAFIIVLFLFNLLLNSILGQKKSPARKSKN